MRLASLLLALLALCAATATVTRAESLQTTVAASAKLQHLQMAANVGARCGTASRGTCLDRARSACSGSWLAGQCPGGASVVCCMPPSTAPAPSAPVQRCGSGSRGTCLNKNSNACSGSWLSGQCTGASNIVCCMPPAAPTPPAPSVQRCGAANAGTCLNRSTNQCSGTWQTGQCVGASNIVCCMPASSAPAPASPGGSATVSRFLSCLRAQLGKPYVYGSPGPSTFDCSGLTSYCARQAGVTIPRVSRDQASWASGRSVTLSQLQPGDFAFFAKPGKDVHHVAVYVGRTANNGYNFIESPYTGLNVRYRDNMHTRRTDFHSFRRMFT